MSGSDSLGDAFQQNTRSENNRQPHRRHQKFVAVTNFPGHQFERLEFQQQQRQVDAAERQPAYRDRQPHVFDFKFHWVLSF